MALWTLQCWIAGRELKKFVLPTILQIQPEPPRQLRFTHPGWYPTLTRRHIYEQETLEAFTRVLQKYLDTSTEAAKLLIRPQGFQPGLKKRELDRHLEWLVLWQVRDWNRSQIGEKYHASPDTVRDGIESAAKEIGLKLSKGKAGRPPKDSDLS